MPKVFISFREKHYDIVFYAQYDKIVSASCNNAQLVLKLQLLQLVRKQGKHHADL